MRLEILSSRDERLFCLSDRNRIRLFELSVGVQPNKVETSLSDCSVIGVGSSVLSDETDVFLGSVSSSSSIRAFK